ncbi:MAG: hypothetical protein QXW97_01670 [Candidatus Pacearchaeota archaeon]
MTTNIFYEENRSVINNKLFNNLESKLKKQNFFFREVKDSFEKNMLISLRSLYYNKRGIKESKIGGVDPFDSFARFFVLDSDDGIVCALKVINKDNPYGILPTELNLMNHYKLRDLAVRIAGGCHDNPWSESTIRQKDKENLKKFLSIYENSNKIYEIGGLFTLDKSKNFIPDCINLMICLGYVGYLEDWDLVIQTQHPRHICFYKRIPFPYIKITDEYIDCCNRSAVTLALERNSFRNRFKFLLENNLIKEFV